MWHWNSPEPKASTPGLPNWRAISTGEIDIAIGLGVGFDRLVELDAPLRFEGKFDAAAARGKPARS